MSNSHLATKDKSAYKSSKEKEQLLVHYLSFFQGFLRTDRVVPSYAVQSERAPRETANRAEVQTHGRYNHVTMKIQLQPEKWVCQHFRH